MKFPGTEAGPLLCFSSPHLVCSRELRCRLLRTRAFQPHLGSLGTLQKHIYVFSLEWDFFWATGITGMCWAILLGAVFSQFVMFNFVLCYRPLPCQEHPSGCGRKDVSRQYRTSPRQQQGWSIEAKITLFQTSGL